MNKIEFNVDIFNKTYKGTKSFCDSPYFSLFLKSLDDTDLMEKIRFANDYLKVPPIVSFVSYYYNVFNHQLERSEKLSLGACFGFLYKYIYQDYVNITAWVDDKITGIKNASYFIKTNKE